MIECSGAAMLFGGILMAAIQGVVLMSSEVAADSETRKIALIGATALAAPDLINQALDAGLEVVGIVRRPEAIDFKHERFTVVKGDVYDVDSIENALEGDEVVISYIDIKMTLGVEVAEEVDLFSRGTANIIEAMKNKGNRRLIIASAVGSENVALVEPPEDVSPSEKLAWHRRRKYDDVRRMEAIVEGSNLDYIILRLPHLVSGPLSGEYSTFVNSNMYNTAIRDENPPRTLTQADLAYFILEQLSSDEYIGKTVGLIN